MHQSHQSFIVSLNTRNDYQTGEAMHLVFKMDHVHFFDAEAQPRIK
ncbi:hypothetical protein [Bacillus cereus]|nr:hypothetical protein [Bacillus cereus]